MQQLPQFRVAEAVDQSFGPFQQVGHVLADTVLTWSIRDPLRNLVADAWAGGTRSMYCSPIADTLLTVAVTLDGWGCRC